MKVKNITNEQIVVQGNIVSPNGELEVEKDQEIKNLIANKYIIETGGKQK